MAHTASEALFALISEVVFGQETKYSFDPTSAEALYTLSSRHDLAHIVSVGLGTRGVTLSPNAERAFLGKKLQAVFRREQFDRETELVSALFEREGIEFIPLKGAVIKELYPEPWLRTGSDVDILIRESDLERAVSLITGGLGYQNEGRKYHEHSLISKSGVHLELHFSVLERNEALDPILVKIWDFSRPKAEKAFERVLSNEFLIFYTVAHAEAHLIGGGCGIRPIIDLALMLQKLDYDGDALGELLTASGSKRLFESLKELSEVWFFGKSPSELSDMLGEFIIGGGQFGSTENYAAVAESKKGGKIKFIFSRIFETTSRMKSMYPILNGRPYLLPFYHIKRWFGLFKREKFSSVKKQLVSGEQAEKAEELFKRLEI